MHSTPCLLPKAERQKRAPHYRPRQQMAAWGRYYIDWNDEIRMYLLKASEFHRPIFWILVSLYPIAAACDAAPMRKLWDFIVREEKDAWERESLSHALNWLADIA